MGTTHLSGLNVAGVPTMGISDLPISDNTLFVDSVNGSDGNTGAFDSPLATTAAALLKCTANTGDVIAFMPGHAETITAAGGIAINVAGVSLIGLGNAANRATFTFGTSTAATMTLSAANVRLSNVTGITTVDQIVSPFVVSAAGVTLGDVLYGPVVWNDGSAILEAVRVILTTAAANNLSVNLIHNGFTAGTHCVNSIRLVGGSNARINIDFYGKASTAVIEFATTATKNTEITGNFYVSGTTDLSKDVVDTITGSTWGVQGWDAAAGAGFSGGSGAAVASDDVSAVSAALLVPAADATTNVNERDVIGNKTDASVYFPASTKSIEAYVKGAADLQDQTIVSSTATMVNASTIFTITGGPIQLLSLVSECVTSNDATASTQQWQSAPTTGAATTFTGASATLASVAAGGSTVVQGLTLATAPIINASGAGIFGVGNSGLYIPTGTIKLVIGVGSTTGTWRHLLRYRPLAKTVSVA